MSFYLCVAAEGSGHIEGTFMKKVVGLILAASMAMAMLTGCSNESNKFESVTYTDSYGHQVTIDAEPQKVVSVSPALTEIVYALGAQDKLVGRTDYCDYPAEVSSIQSVGAIDNPDTELIASLSPDLVIASSIFTEDSYNKLTELGIKVIVIKDETTINGMFDYVTTMGNILGKKDEAGKLVESMKADLEAVKANSVSSDVTVYYCMGYGEYGEYTAGGDTFINDIIVAAGAKNAAADISGWTFSLEALIAADPDYILVPAWGYDAFIATAPYSELSAVKNGNVISVDNNLFERVGPRNIEAIKLIQNAILEDAKADAAA